MAYFTVRMAGILSEDQSIYSDPQPNDSNDYSMWYQFANDLSQSNSVSQIGSMHNLTIG